VFLPQYALFPEEYGYAEYAGYEEQLVHEGIIASVEVNGCWKRASENRERRENDSSRKDKKPDKIE